MNENGSGKKREWVKTAAIIFLSVLLVLTFFSNTIMNYSLPEVAVQYVQPGSITAKIRGTGSVESGDPYHVEVQESRKVQSVAVRVGDMVEKGDVIMYLDDTESEELKAAREELETAQDAYDLALLSADISAELIVEANTGVPTESYRQQITNAQNAVKEEQKKVDEWQKKYDNLDNQIKATPENTANVEAETKAFNAAKIDLENKKFAKKAAEIELEKFLLSISDGDAEGPMDMETVAAKQTELENKVAYADLAIEDAQLVFEQAEAALNNKVVAGNTESTVDNLKNQLNAVSVNLEAAKKVLAEKETVLTDLITKINAVLGLQNNYEAVEAAQKVVNEQVAKTQNATIKAGVAGTITSLNVIAGKTTTPGDPVAVIQPEGKGYYMSFTVTNAQAKRVSVGDYAELVNAWRYEDVEVKLTSIKPDPQNPGQQKLLTFDITGSVTPGQTLNVSLGQKSANYDLIVPNSCIREDNNGKFVLIVESKNSPLGNRYYAKRVDVEVLASDDTQSAINGALYGWEYVITTATQPVEAGQLVRLAEN